MCLRSGDGFQEVLVVDHDPKFTSDVFLAFVQGMCSSLISGLAYHKNTKRLYRFFLKLEPNFSKTPKPKKITLKNDP